MKLRRFRALPLVASISLLSFIAACATSPTGPEERAFLETGNGLETVVILGTNDIHGALSPEVMKTKDEDPIIYEKGGASILAAHVRLLQQEYGKRLLILDGGDEFQGSIDSNLGQGEPMVQLFNSLPFNAAVIGNHEFDFGPVNPTPGKPAAYPADDIRGAIKTRISEAKYPYLAANIYKKNGKFPGLTGTQASTILQAGNLKVGVIGLTTLDTPTSTRSIFVKDLEFRDFVEIAKTEAKKLRDQGAQIIVALTHAGVFCDVANKSGKPIKTGMLKTPTDVQSECSDQEIPRMLRKLPAGTIDAVVSGHTHTVVHHWIEGVPVIQSGTRNQYYNLLYLTYDTQAKKLLPERTRIEGPVPVCPLVFANQKNCNGDQIPPKNGRGRLVKPSFHGKTIEPDAATEELLRPIFARTEESKKRVMARAARKIDHTRKEESPLGNLVADAMRKATGAQVAIMNGGGIRAPFQSGDVLYEDVFRTLPFDNTVARLTVTGKELKMLLRIAESGARGFFPVSGVKLRLIGLEHEPRSSDLNHDGKIEPWEMDRLIEVTLQDGTPIDDRATYTVASIDFLVTGGDSMGWIMDQIPKSRIDMNAGGMVRDALNAHLNSFKEPLNSEEQPLVNPKEPRMKFEAPPKGKAKKATKKRSSKKRQPSSAKAVKKKSAKHR